MSIYKQIAKWMLDHPEGFCIIWDGHSYRTQRFTYRKIVKECRVPLRALKTGQIRRVHNGEKFVNGAIVTPNIIKFHPAKKFLLVTNHESIKNHDEVLAWAKENGRQVEVIYVD